MKVAKSWLRELVDLRISDEELVSLLPLRTITTKEGTENFVELDMKGYNRTDLLSMRGVAFEVAAITDSETKFEDPAENDYYWVKKSLDKTPISISDQALCETQVVVKIDNLKVEKSPDSWIKKLNDSGMRSVDNITDVTNLIMLEYGQPLHAFDTSSVKDQTINVRQANDNEEIITLDGKLRKLTAQDIVLADTEKALDVAGVMGGKDTEVKKATTSILLSASLFNKATVRNTAIRLGLYSEASKRFQHGLTKKRLLQAVNAAIKMYQEIGGKMTALTIVGETEDQPKKIPLSLKRVNELIGVDLSPKQVEESLVKLGFELKMEVNSKLEPAWVVTPPYFRLDIAIEEDLIEEVARMYGYERIKPQELSGKLPGKIDQSLFELIQNLKTKLSKVGLTEVQTYSFFSSKVLEALGSNDANKKVLIRVKNPISAETEYLRMNLWPNLVEVISKNIRQGYKDIAIFELGKEYFLANGDIDEHYTLSLALMNGTANPLAEIYQIFKKLNSDLKLNLETKEDKPAQVLAHLFHPKRFLKLDKDGAEIGGMAEVHQRITDKMGLNHRVAILEVELTKF